MMERVLGLLRLLAERPDIGARVPEIGARLSMHRVSVHRLLKNLVDLGYVEQGEDRRYYLGLEAWYLGAAAASRFRLPARVLEAMARVAAETQDVVFLMRRTGREAVCVSRCEGSYPVRSLVMDVGSRRPLGVGATSLAILAALDDAEARDVMEANAQAYRHFGRIDAAFVARCVDETRARGFSVSRGMVIPEVFSVGVVIPARRSNRFAAGLSVATIESRLGPERQASVATVLAREAAIIGASFPARSDESAHDAALQASRETSSRNHSVLSPSRSERRTTGRRLPSSR